MHPGEIYRPCLGFSLVSFTLDEEKVTNRPTYPVFPHVFEEAGQGKLLENPS